MTTLSRAEFLNALDTVKPAVLGKTTMPVLACVLIADGYVTATDLALTIRAPIKYPSTAPRLTVPHVELRAAVAGMRGAEVSIELDGNSAHVVVKSGPARVRIMCFELNEYPEVKSPGEDAVWFDLDASAIAQVAYAISTETSRDNLCGVHLTETHAEAADGYRLAMCPWVAPAGTDVIIPEVGVRVVLRVAKTCPARMCITDQRAYVEAAGAIIGMRTIDAQYPNLKSFLPKYETGQHITVNADTLRDSVRSVSKFSSKVRSLLIDVEEQKIRLLASDADRGESSDEVDCFHEFDGAVRSAFNWGYFADALEAVSGGDAWLFIAPGMTPSVITSPRSSAVHVVMPAKR